MGYRNGQYEEELANLRSIFSRAEAEIKNGQDRAAMLYQNIQSTKSIAGGEVKSTGSYDDRLPYGGDGPIGTIESHPNDPNKFTKLFKDKARADLKELYGIDVDDFGARYVEYEGHPFDENAEQQPPMYITKGTRYNLYYKGYLVGGFTAKLGHAASGYDYVVYKTYSKRQGDFDKSFPFRRTVNAKTKLTIPILIETWFYNYSRTWIFENIVDSPGDMK